MAPALLDGLTDAPGWVVGDRGLSSDALRAQAWAMGARPVIPTKKNEAPVRCPDFIYVHRNRIERLWGRLKEWRAVATVNGHAQTEYGSTSTCRILRHSLC